MNIVFTKISDEEHRVRVVRKDKSTEEATLNSRSFIRHDFAHMAVELEVPLRFGYWGSVAAGTSLDGMNITGKDIMIAESLAGPVQTLIRMEADVDQYKAILDTIRPELASQDLAERIHERARKLMGHWKATAFGSDMILEWPLSIEKAS